jgi:hypothetical protein
MGLSFLKATKPMVETVNRLVAPGPVFAQDMRNIMAVLF